MKLTRDLPKGVRVGAIPASTMFKDKLLWSETSSKGKTDAIVVGHKSKGVKEVHMEPWKWEIEMKDDVPSTVNLELSSDPSKQVPPTPPSGPPAPPVSGPPAPPSAESLQTPPDPPTLLSAEPTGGPPALVLPPPLPGLSKQKQPVGPSFAVHFYPVRSKLKLKI